MTDETRPNETFSELHGMTGVPGLGTDPPSRMVRQGPWKLYHYRGHESPALYNLDDDPGELHDLGSGSGVRGRAGAPDGASAGRLGP